MHSNNNNDYEIIDSNTSPYPSDRNNDYSKYPYKNNPNQLLQYTNYKDCLNNCRINQKYNGNPENFADADTIAGTSAGIIIAGTMLGAFAAPITSAVIISFGTLLPIIWKSDEEAKTTWKAFITIGNRPFNSVVDQTIVDLLYDSIKGLQFALNEYNRQFNSWKASRTPATATAVLNTFHTIHLNLIIKLQGTLSGQYKIQMLPGYAQVANWHLNLLQQASLYYDEWVKDSGKPAEIYFEEYVTPSNEINPCLNTCSSLNDTANSAYYKCSLKCYIKEYTNYCTKTYNDGLNILKTQSEPLWNLYNAYRREITLTVLDLVALFPNYDPEYYPIGVQSEITRIIYTDANSDKFKTITQLEQALTLEPSLFFSIIHLNFYTRNFRQPTDYQNVFAFTANQVFFKYANNQAPIIGSPIYGNHNETDELKTIDFNIYYSIDMIKIIRHRDFPTIITNILFFSNNTEIFRYSTNSSLDPNYLRTDTFMIPKGESNHTKYVHKLAYMKTDNNITNIGTNRERTFAFGWTHANVNLNNIVYADKITQIPAVKAFQISSDSRVERGPGHTGGDLVRLQNSMQLQVTFASDMTQTYKIRIRYASNLNLNVTLQIANVTQRRIFSRTFTGNKNSKDLLYEDFGYHEFTEPLGPPTVTTRTITLQSIAGNSDQLFIDKIEFIPITQQYLETSKKEKVETIQQRMNNLFIDPRHQFLQTKATDYEIDQMANEIETISEKWYPQEKMMLLDEIKHAKHLSQFRNILQNGDFENWNNWTTTNESTIQTGNPAFKAYFLHMPGARTTEIDNTVFPTYVSQKIDESRLKPYTRYLVRGFMESSKHLELSITRYYQEIHTMMNVSNTINSYQTSDISIPNSQLPTDFCTCNSNTKQTICEDPHAFSFHIDTGTLDFKQNLGIQLLFNISDPDGYATLGNLEIIEERSLTEEEIYNVQQQEQKWKETKEKQQQEIEQIYSQAQQAVQSLFLNHNTLQSETNMLAIVQADRLLNKIPNFLNTLFQQEQNENDNLYTNLKQQISQAYLLYQNRNAVRNGNFKNGTKYWSTSPQAIVQQIDHTSVLVIPNWSTQVSQQIQVQTNYRYLFRVIAKKEENGTGYVKISDCANQIETLSFSQSDSYTNQIEYEIKTIHITPHTDQVRIDIGETEGTFKINSIELICIHS